MKLFGIFLVEQGIITKGDLVGALIEQVKSTPSVPDIVHSFAAVSDEDFIRIFKIQHQKKCDFISACHEAGVWNAELEEKVLTAIRAVRKPLGRVLFDAGKITSAQLAHALDEFVVEAEDDEPAMEEKLSTKTNAVAPEELSEQPPSSSVASADVAIEKVEFDFISTTFDKNLLE